jgi:hypothetical protein
MTESELGLLGQQLRLALAAFDQPLLQHYCAVRQEEHSGHALMGASGEERRFLEYDALPGSLHVKAIGIDPKTMFIELAPYDAVALREEHTESILPKGVRVDGRGVWFGRRKIASVVRSSPAVEAEHGPRALWTISRSLPADSLALAIATLDALDVDIFYEIASDKGYSHAYVGPAVGMSGSSQRMEMRLTLDLALEQKPVLALRQEGRMRTEMHMDLELRALQRFERWLASSPKEAIDAALAKDSSPAGQNRLAKMICFKLAGDVKRAADERGRPITWPQAREIVRRSMAQQG